MWEQIIVGMIGGLSYSLSGWAKNNSKLAVGQSIDWQKLGVSSLIGLVWGIVSVLTGQDLSVIATGSMGVGITALVQNLFKTFKG